MTTWELVGCPYDAWRWWYRPAVEENPGHECSQNVPQGIVMKTFVEVDEQPLGRPQA